jgi:uncharacterized protein YggE
VTKTIVLISTLCALILTPSLVTAQSQPPSPPSSEPVVVMTGEGVVKIAPDQAWVTIGAESRSRNPKEAQSQNAAAMTAVQQKLTAAGIAKDAIRTLAVDLQLESDWVNGRQVPRGYVARNTIEVRLDDIIRVGEIMDMAVTGGATTIHGVRFDVKQRESHERDALKRATADARARAEAAAAGAGRTIDRVIRIEEPISRPVPMPMPMMSARTAEDARAQTPVAAGEIEIRATVVLTATMR